MDKTSYSNVILDSYGNFCPLKFLRLFLEAAARENLTYPSVIPFHNGSNSGCGGIHSGNITPQQQPYYASSHTSQSATAETSSGNTYYTSRPQTASGATLSSAVDTSSSAPIASNGDISSNVMKSSFSAGSQLSSSISPCMNIKPENQNFDTTSVASAPNSLPFFLKCTNSETTSNLYNNSTVSSISNHFQESHNTSLRGPAAVSAEFEEISDEEDDFPVSALPLNDESFSGVVLSSPTTNLRSSSNQPFKLAQSWDLDSNQINDLSNRMMPQNKNISSESMPYPTLSVHGIHDRVSDITGGSDTATEYSHYVPPYDSSLPQELSQNKVVHKLKLVLDLDNTLLHACAKSKMGNADIKLEDFLSPDGVPELYKFSLPQILNQTYYVKLRPGLKRFLSELSHYCDLAIHTNATHEYADVIIGILDPDHSLFCGRVAAREDETTKDHKKNMDRLFRIDDLDTRSLIILDDRKDVWDDAYQPNIIHCGMYDYLDSRKSALIEKYSLINQLPTLQPSSSSQSDSHSEHEIELQPPCLPTRDIDSENENGSGSVSVSVSGSVSDNDSIHLNNFSSTIPFLDNPLLEQSALISSRDINESYNCEDDDIILPDVSEDLIHTDTHPYCRILSTSDISASHSSSINEDTNELIPPLTVDSQYNGPPHSFIDSSDGEIITENLRMAAQLPNNEELLIDYDCQLDYLRCLIIYLAEEFNRLKLSFDTVDAASVSQLLGDRRKDILKGLTIQTAGMYKSEASHPEYGWHDNGPVHRRRLVNLGAKVVEAPTSELTHILAMRATQTIDRVRKERGSEVNYVHALWLPACEATWERIPEKWFPAIPLLKKYENTPPKKPWVDHWRMIALQNETLCQRLQFAITQYNQHSIIPPGKDRLQDTTEQSTIHQSLHTTHTLGQLSIHPLSSDSQDTHHYLTSRHHFVTAPQSHGANVWSATEHISLIYNASFASQLKVNRQQLQENHERLHDDSSSSSIEIKSHLHQEFGTCQYPPQYDEIQKSFQGSHRRRRRSYNDSSNISSNNNTTIGTLYPQRATDYRRKRYKPLPLNYHMMGQTIQDQHTIPPIGGNRLLNQTTWINRHHYEQQNGHHNKDEEKEYTDNDQNKKVQDSNYIDQEDTDNIVVPRRMAPYHLKDKQKIVSGRQRRGRRNRTHHKRLCQNNLEYNDNWNGATQQSQNESSFQDMTKIHLLSSHNKHLNTHILSQQQQQQQHLITSNQSTLQQTIPLPSSQHSQLGGTYIHSNSISYPSPTGSVAPH